MVVNSPLIRPAISWGGGGIGGVPLDSHDSFTTVAGREAWCKQPIGVPGCKICKTWCLACEPGIG